ncbi:MAG TPA: hypothetical protein VGI81_08120 [Tepidisphaeraceae bacterium]|jgi:Spy/CpxP family protein refolding chaperone
MADTIWSQILTPEIGDLSPELARFFLSLSLTETQKQRYRDLAAKDQLDLSPAEQSELNELVQTNQMLMLLQAKARRSLAERQPAA